MGARTNRLGRGLRPLVSLAILAAGILVFVHLSMPSWYARWWYPLEHEDAITAESRATSLDPSLVAAVIFQESKFDAEARSDKGAVGLMQVLPATAMWIHRQRGAPAAPPSELARPAVNIAYGTWYLKYLRDRYGSDELALAAYNGGETNLAAWIASSPSRDLAVGQIPYPETRGFVRSVTAARSVYRSAWAETLGIGDAG